MSTHRVNYTYFLELEFNGQLLKHSCKSVQKCADWVNSVYGVDIASVSIINNLLYNKVVRGSLNNIKITKVSNDDQSACTVSNVGVSRPSVHKKSYRLLCDLKGIHHDVTFNTLDAVADYLNGVFSSKLVSAAMVSAKVRNIPRDNILNSINISKI